MSGISETKSCPICGNEADVYTDWKPVDYSTIECVYCGFYLEPKTGQMTMAEVNDRRKDFNENYEPDKPLKPLTKKDLKKYEKDIKNFW